MGHPNDAQVLEELMSFSSEVFCALDPNGLVVRVSPACLAALGFEPAGLLGRPFADLLHAADRAEVAAQLHQAASDGPQLCVHCRCLTRTGPLLHMVWLVNRAPASGLLFCFGKPAPPQKPNVQPRLRNRTVRSTARAQAADLEAAARGRDESEQRFRLLFENNLSMSAFQDAEGLTLEINSAFLLFLQQAKQAVVHRQLTDFLAPSFRTLFTEKFKEAIGGHTVRYNAAAINADGQEITLSVTKTPLIMNGKIIGIHVAALDTTAFTAAQEELAHLAEQHLTILESITGGVLSFDTQWNLIYINREAERLFGIAREAQLGKNIWQIFPEVARGQYQGQSEEAFLTGCVTQFETFMPRLRRWLDVKMFPSPNGLLVYILDVTEQLEGAKQLRQLALVAEGTDNGVVIADAEGRTEWVNAGFTRHTGFTLADMVGRKCGHVLQGPETDPAAVHLFREGLQQRAPFSVTILNYTKTGEKLWLVIDVTPIHNQAGELTQFIAIQHNISFRKETEARQAQMTQDLYQHNRDLQQFTYIISHNLRAPLANGLGLATMLTKLGKNTAGFDLTLGYLRESMAQADAVIKDLNRVLSVRDKQEAPEPVDLAEVCEQALASLKGSLAQCGAQVRVDIAAGLAVGGTRAYLYSIFDNLLSNAIKYRSAQRPLEVTIRAAADNGSDATISIADNGSGFDTQKAGADVFQLYKRFHSSQPGRGIGLFLAKTHVEAMHGHIDVTSTVDVGTTFLFTLPRFCQ
ncbi:hypothetical protein GCM10022409_02940 [Hymenobacter glaciei]|uniref:histidine kinase n=1 Tax=Hymenobacter glaciei TaxID=877209 RepID=A0ABP7T8F6_9BACT